MVGKPINLSYLVVGLHGLKIFEIRFGEKVHIVQGSNVKTIVCIEVQVADCLGFNFCLLSFFFLASSSSKTQVLISLVVVVVKVSSVLPLFFELKRRKKCEAKS